MEAPILFRELIGERGQSRTAAQAALAEWGVPVQIGSIPSFRNKRHDYDGNRTMARLDYSLFKKIGAANAKIEHYLDIGQTGEDLKKPQKIRPHRLSGEGLAKSIAEQLGLSGIEFSRQLRAIRLDICASERMEPDQRVVLMFLDMANEYINAHTKPANADVNKRVKAISENWDSLTIGDFYRTFYRETYGSGISTLGPYETGFIRDYYQMLRGEQSRLSPFDRYALEAMITGQASKYAEDLRNWTGIPIDDSIIYSHVGVLAAPSDPKV